MYEENERRVIESSELPILKSQLIDDFRKIGLKEGDNVVVHSSLSKIGWIPGKAVPVIEALMEIITEKGTLVMPTHTSDNSDPKNWQHPPVPEAWKPIIREHMPAYDPRISPTRGMGIIVDTFLHFLGVIRSNHPSLSFAAWGKYAELIAADHPLTPSFGINSPLGRLYELKGKIMLLGVDHLNNSSLHIAENIAGYPGAKLELLGSAIMKDGKRIWATWEEKEFIDEDFLEIGKAYEESINYKRGNVGYATTALLNQADLIDFAVEWMLKNRK
ncbi:MAG: AAC(3) family N-acetyltransferase [Promethearchaeota archaeon]|nr:MAG: AAC(3) family N-acetyltransferase [Candidatus Lokiarchaeota archaeon]